MDGELNTVGGDLDMPFELKETQGSQRGNVKSKADFQDKYYSSFNADGTWPKATMTGEERVEDTLWVFSFLSP